MRGPFYLFCFSCLSAGILVGRELDLLAIAALLAAFACIALAVFRWRPGCKTSAILGMAFMALGIILMCLAVSSARDGIIPRLAHRGSICRVSGIVSSPPAVNGGSATFFMQARDVKVSGRAWTTREKVMVRLDGGGDSALELFPGASLAVNGAISGNGGGDRWLIDHGADAVIQATAHNLEKGNPAAGPASLALNRLRAWISKAYRRLFDRRVSGFIEGVTLGKQNLMDPSIDSDLRGCGLSHIVAVSGLHVGSAAMIVLGLMSMLGAGRRSRYICAGIMAVFVLALANFRPSATRAAIMAGLCFSGVILGRDYDSLVGLSVAGILILGTNPRTLFDPGFQFSFAAALGIVLAVRNRSRSGGRLRLFLTVCAGAQLGVLPIMILKGEGIPVTAVAANLIVVPLVGPLLFTSWGAALATTVFTPLGKTVAMAPGGVARFILSTASVMSRVPRAGVIGGLAGFGGMLMYTAGLVVIARRAKRGAPLLRPVALLTSAVLLMLVPSLPIVGFRASDRVTFLDVGQGDAVLIQDRYGAAVLVDGGPDERTIMSKLQSRGITHLDLAVCSHPHSDHLAGLVEVLREMPVGRLMDAGVDPGSSGVYSELLKVVRQKRIPRTVAREGQSVTVSPGINMEVVYAPEGLQDAPENINDCSVVMIADLEGARVLLPGDIESTGQQELLGSHPDLSCDVLKVPHQGARNAATPELLDSCRPSLAVISVEKGNRYGHPSARSLSLLGDRGIGVFRTDEQGDITISVANGKMGVTTGAGE